MADVKLSYTLDWESYNENVGAEVLDRVSQALHNNRVRFDLKLSELGQAFAHVYLDRVRRDATLKSTASDLKDVIDEAVEEARGETDVVIRVRQSGIQISNV